MSDTRQATLCHDLRVLPNRRTTVIGFACLVGASAVAFSLDYGES